MNKTTKLLNLLLVLALVVGMCMILPSLSAQQQEQPSAQQQQPDTSTQQAPASMMSQTSDEQTFSGRVAKAGGKFVLRDTANKATYILDDQDKAKQFEGQEVKVSGSLDAQTRTIRVSSIAPGS